MLTGSTRFAFPTILRRTVRIALMPVASMRVKPLGVVLLCSVVLLGVALSAPVTGPQAPSPMVLDDFTEGLFQKPLSIVSDPGVTKSERDFQSGDSARLVGGVRETFFGVDSLLRQPGILDIQNGHLIVSTGYKTFHGLQVIYGHDQRGRLRSLSLPLTSMGYDRFRVHFEAVTGGVNLNIVVFTNDGRGRAQLGFNIPPNGGSDWDFPFAAFTPAVGPPLEPPNFDDVDVIVLQPNSGGSGVGGNDFAITSFIATCALCQ